MQSNSDSKLAVHKVDEVVLALASPTNVLKAYETLSYKIFSYAFKLYYKNYDNINTISNLK